MAYLGRGIENLSDRVVLDSLTASATASYTLQLNSVNFVPSSASSLTVSLNGVIQKPDSSYTVSGSTLTFSSALTSSDSIDFIIAERGITLQTPSAGSVNTEQLAANAVNNSKIASDAAIATTKLGTGAVLQVKQTAVTSTSSVSGTSYSDLSGMSVSITPSASNSKILVMFSLNFGTDSSGGDIHVRLLRGSTAIGQPNNSSNNDCHTSAGSSRNQFEMSNVSSTFLDTPSTTSATTYKIQAVSRPDTSGRTLYLNRTVNDNQSDNGERTASTITVMEIAG